MHFSEGLLERAARAAAAPAESQAARGTNRIIAAERLPGYRRFTLDQLEGSRSPGFPMAGKAHDGRADAVANLPRGLFARFDEPTRNTSEASAAQGATGLPAGYEAGYQAGREAGLSEGFEQGFAAGSEEAMAAQRQRESEAGIGLAQHIAALSASLNERFTQIESQAADELIGFALEVARQALRASIALRPEAIVDVVREALGHLLDERAHARIHLNPADVQFVQIGLGQASAPSDVELVADHSIERGGCRIETPLAQVDARLETRWRRTLEAIGREPDGSLAGADKADDKVEVGDTRGLSR